MSAPHPSRAPRPRKGLRSLEKRCAGAWKARSIFFKNRVVNRQACDSSGSRPTRRRWVRPRRPVLDKAPVLPSSSQMARTRRAPGRWIQRAGGPLCLSIFAHAALAVTAGTYLKLRQPPPAAQVVAMDVDVVELPGVPAATSRADAPPSAAPSRAAPHHRLSSASRSATDRAVDPAVAVRAAATPERFVLVVG